jgi:hypothetical protein
MNGVVFQNSLRPTGSLSRVDHGASNNIIVEILECFMNAYFNYYVKYIDIYLLSEG